MSSEFPARVAAGSLRESVRADASLPHQWTDAGVAVELNFTGAHLLHLSVAACVLNDLYREAAAMNVRVDGVRVDAQGGFDTSTWRSTGIHYSVELDAGGDEAEIAALIQRVDEVAEIPRVLRAGAPVDRLHTDAVVDGGT